MAKRWSTGRILGTLFLGTLAVLGLYAGWVVLETNRRWEEMGREVERLLREEAARESPRVRLRPVTEEGNAWPDYLRAIRGAAEFKGWEAWNAIQAFRQNDNPNLRGEVKSLLNERRAILDALSSGVRKELIYVDREAWLRTGHPYQGTAASHVMTMAVCDGRLRAALGDPAAAVERLIDILQFSRDWMDCGAQGAENSYLAGTYFVKEEVERLLQSGGLAPDLRSKLDRALRDVEESAPGTDAALRVELARAGGNIRRLGLEGLAREVGLQEPPRPGPGDLFSERRWLLSYYGDFQDATAGALDQGDWSWAREKAYWDALPPSPVLDRFGHPCVVAWTLRPARAYLRLARAALAWHATGETPAEADPYGDVLRSTVVGGQLTLWSVGYNGIDDGGGQRDLVIRARR